MDCIACHSIPLSRIRSARFCMRDDVRSEELAASIKAHGLLQPLTVSVKSSAFELIDGHRRFWALKKRGVSKVLTVQLSPREDGDLFLTALTLNSAAGYSEMDRCRIIQCAAEEFQFSDSDIQNRILPLLGLAVSPKILKQYRLTASLPETLKQKIRKKWIPFHGSYAFTRIQTEDLNFLIRFILPRIRPTASQTAHLCEWLADLGQVQKKPLKVILKPIPLSAKGDFRVRTDFFYEAVRALRFPDIAKKERAFKAAVKEWGRGTSGVQWRATDHFEQEGFYLQAHLRNAKEFERFAAEMSRLQKPVSALFDTVL